jgi:hypothetical protein
MRGSSQPSTVPSSIVPQLALGGDRVGELEPGEFGLTRLVAGQRAVLEVPVVERAVAVELERAQRVGDALDRIALPVRPVVGGVDAPVVARAVVVLVADAIHDRVAQLHVVVLHVGLGAQHVRAVGQLARAHAAEQRQVLVDAAVAVRALDARLAVPAALHGDGVAVLVVDVGEAGDDEVLGPQVQLFEVVAGVEHLGGLEAQPSDVVDDRVDVLGVFGDGVGVVEAQLADAAELARDAEVDADRLRGRCATIGPVGSGLHPATERAGLVVGAHEVAHEVRGGRSIGRGGRGGRGGGGGGVAHRVASELEPST